MIESLNSPHVGRVKALLSLKKERIDSKRFVAEGLQSVREALLDSGSIETLYLTKAGAERLQRASFEFSNVNTLEVSDKVAEAMSDAMTTQGIIAICKMPNPAIETIDAKQIIYLSEIQDPGNAGTILRTADAMGIKAIVTSPGSVDFFSPKVVRATAGSLWHLPLYVGIELSKLQNALPNHKLRILDGSSAKRIYDVDFKEPCIWIFGNEARGLKDEISGAERVSISMPGNAESLNLAAAAAIVMHEISRG
jgi:TrmH family RNA methyltransferase